MPELGEQMYCSQQICIPPTYPYLLRQFAKAAIRTQPNDLLKWATTYFRCLSLNIPPPVKPRLEYPIPKDHCGITPGWLRALLHQMEGSQTVTFKVLWDRWIGACLQHTNLIQILCLGGFDNNMAIPWLRFIGLCAAHLTENLTQTMILICEILSEEPEGGSAMITIETFLDLYQFLARIDASIPQTLRNYYFLDKFLELYQEKIAKDSGAQQQEEEPEEEVFSLVSSESTQKSDREGRRDDDGSAVSCPSVGSQDPDNYMKLLMKMREGDEGEEYYEDAKSVLKDDGTYQKVKADIGAKDDQKKEKVSLMSEAVDETLSVKAGDPDDEIIKKDTELKKFTDQLAEDGKFDIFPPDRDDVASRDTEVTSVKTAVDDLTKLEEDEYLKEDLERLRAVQQELMGESDDELEKFKASILADAGLTASQMEAPAHFEEQIQEPESSSTAESVKSEVSSSTKSSEKEKTPVEEVEYENVPVDAVPGIGPKVPEEIIAAVCGFMKDVSKIQEGMVMPRNIRHYDCPPLEIYHD